MTAVQLDSSLQATANPSHVSCHHHQQSLLLHAPQDASPTALLQASAGHRVHVTGLSAAKPATSLVTTPHPLLWFSTPLLHPPRHLL